MSVLLNQRHERYAQFIAQGCTKKEAYEMAGYKMNSRNSWKLEPRFPEVEKRIKELQSKRERKMRNADVEQILTKTEAAQILSLMARDTDCTENGRRLAVVVMARMYGWNSPEELHIKNQTDMSDSELELIIKGANAVQDAVNEADDADADTPPEVTALARSQVTGSEQSSDLAQDRAQLKANYKPEEESCERSEQDSGEDDDLFSE